MGESILRDRRILFECGPFSEGPGYRKGIGLIFPNQDVDNEWQHKRNRGTLAGAPGRVSFLLNSSVDLGIGLPGDKVQWLGKRHTFRAVRCASDDP